ncbi:MAG TPA: hypothetical protein VMX33_02860 [bacterium]|nr:hypothetical protein [bacterium]
MKKRNWVLFAFVAIIATVLSGCAMLGAMGKMASVPKEGAPIPDDKVVIVGRIVFTPEPVQNIDGDMIALGGGGIKQSVDLGFTFAADKKIIFDKGNADVLAHVKWGEYFVLTVPRKTLFLNAIGFVTDSRGNTVKSVMGTCNVGINIGPDDRLIYIGDVNFRFGVKNSMGGTGNDVRVLDNYDDLKKSFTMTFQDGSGGTVEMKQDLAVVPEGKSAVVYDRVIQTTVTTGF